MKRAVASAGVVGLLTGGLVLASNEAAMAKSDVLLSAKHKTVRKSRTIRFAGSVGDDAGLRRTLICLQVRGEWGRWTRVGRCVRPYRSGGYFADFRLTLHAGARGRHVYRAVGLDPRGHHRIYGPSPTVTIIVR